MKWTIMVSLSERAVGQKGGNESFVVMKVVK